MANNKYELTLLRKKFINGLIIFQLKEDDIIHVMECLPTNESIKEMFLWIKEHSEEIMELMDKNEMSLLKDKIISKADELALIYADSGDVS